MDAEHVLKEIEGQPTVRPKKLSELADRKNLIPDQPASEKAADARNENEPFKCAICLQEFKIFQSDLVPIGVELKRVCLRCASRIGSGTPSLEKKPEVSEQFFCFTCRKIFPGRPNAYVNGHELCKACYETVLLARAQSTAPPNSAPAGQKNAGSSPSAADPGVFAAPPPATAPAAPPEGLNGLETLQKLREDRGAVYGDIKINHKTIGKMVTGLLENHYQMKLPHDVPGHIVALIMVMVKANRAAAPFKFNNDTYDDGMNYFDIARRVDPRSGL